MADFNATTSKIENTTAGNLAGDAFSFLVWMYLDGFGEGEFGRVLLIDENGNSRSMFVDGFGTSDRFWVAQEYSIGNGSWHTGNFSLVTGRWFCVAVSFNIVDDQSLPNMYILDTDSDSSLQLKSEVESSNPSGTPTAANTGYIIGNRPASDRTFDGRLNYLQYWTAALNQDELNAAAFWPGRIRRDNLKLFTPLLGTDPVDLSNQSQTGTATALANADPPPVALPFGFDIEDQSVAVGDINTENKRRSVWGAGLPWMRMPAVPDGTIDVADRAQMRVYSGLISSVIVTPVFAHPYWFHRHNLTR